MFDFAGMRSRAANAIIAPLFILPTVAFVVRLLGLDRRLARQEVVGGMSWVLRRYYAGVRHVCGAVPPKGPVLLVGNHPGLGDLPALAVVGGRDDLRAVAKERALMADMHGVLGRCVLINESLASRAKAVRRVIDAFRRGEAVVVYPGSDIEPDPAVFGDQSDFLAPWEPYIDTIIRRAARAGLTVPVVPVYTEGVHSVPRSLRWLVPPTLGTKAREGRAALITMMTRLARSRPVVVAVGRPITLGSRSSSRGSRAADDADLTAAARAELYRLRDSVRSAEPSPAPAADYRSGVGLAAQAMPARSPDG